jgi:hypothetical protein
VVSGRNGPDAPIKQAFRASSWRPYLSGTLQGFFRLQLPSGLIINNLTLHQKGAKRWVGLPGVPQIEAGRHRIDPATGKPAYTPALEISDRQRRAKFTEQALAALDRLLRQ